jgi:hypothetical protein
MTEFQPPSKNQDLRLVAGDRYARLDSQVLSFLDYFFQQNRNTLRSSGLLGVFPENSEFELLVLLSVDCRRRYAEGCGNT